MKTVALLLATMSACAPGVIIYDGDTDGTDDGRQALPPTDDRLAAWNLQGRIFNFNMSPIAPNAFVMARHITGGSEQPGTSVTFGGQSFETVSKTDIPGTDLRVWTINGTFSSYASLWNPAVDGSVVGKPLVVIGRGRARGSAITAPIDDGPSVSAVTKSIQLTGGSAATLAGPSAAPSGDLRGWSWGIDNRLQSWGANVVDSTVIDNTFGELLTFDFDAEPGQRVPGEAIVAEGDSSGGVFVYSGGEWKLAGVNLGVDGRWSYTKAGPYGTAAIFDGRGLWLGTTATNGQQVPATDTPWTASSYASGIGGNYTAIMAAINGGSGSGSGLLVPEPALVSLALLLPILSRRPR